MQTHAFKVSEVVQEISQNGYAIIDDFIDAGLVKSLAQHAQSLKELGAMKRAATGLNRNLHQEFRGDFIHWIEPLEASIEEQSYLAFSLSSNVLDDYSVFQFLLTYGFKLHSFIRYVYFVIMLNGGILPYS